MTAAVASRVRVRHATSADADAIRRLDGPSDASRQLLGHDLAAADRCCLVVEDDAEVVGYAAAIVQLGEAQVTDVVVAPARRGTGIGGRLFDALLDAVAARGARAITLEVRVDNLAAQSLYRRRGFVVEGRRPRYYADGTDALIMWRRPVSPDAEPDAEPDADREGC